MNKVCPLCKRLLDASCFYRNDKRKDGLSSLCKECKKIYQDRWYKENRNKENTKRKSRIVSRKESNIKYLSDSGLRCSLCGHNRVSDLRFFDVSTGVSSVIPISQPIDKIKDRVSCRDVICSRCIHILANERMKNKKSAQVGMNISTATAILRKNIIFRLAGKCGELTCIRCGKQISNPEDLSLDHIIPWLDSSDPKSLFFDPENVRFSHAKCNLSATRHKNKNMGV